MPTKPIVVDVTNEVRHSLPCGICQLTQRPPPPRPSAHRQGSRGRHPGRQISSALADQKHNAAQAEYDRLAALVSPEAPEIPGGIMSADPMPRFMDASIFLATVLAFALVRLGAMHFK